MVLALWLSPIISESMGDSITLGFEHMCLDLSENLGRSL